MSTKKVKEWNVDAPWGKIALISWGNPKNPPVLLVHGFMDSAATFILLLDQLPKEYYYVGFDMPGHGKSDTFPRGLLISQLDIVEVIRRVIRHLKWNKFTLMAHSMGCVIGMFYNSVFPDQIKMMIFIDVGLPLSVYYYIQNRPAEWFNYIYNDYYNNYLVWNSGIPRLHTYDKAISLVVRNRRLTEEQAEVVLSRSLIPMGIDTYKLSWEPRMKKISQPAIPEDTLYILMTANFPPTLSIEASETRSNHAPSMKFAENLLNKCEETLEHFFRITVTGGHDVHITHSESLALHIRDFMKGKHSKKKSFSIKSKL